MPERLTTTARPLEDWYEKHWCAIWTTRPDEEFDYYVGAPDDDDWPVDENGEPYFRWWVPFPSIQFPQSVDSGAPDPAELRDLLSLASVYHTKAQIEAWSADQRCEAANWAAECIAAASDNGNSVGDRPKHVADPQARIPPLVARRGEIMSHTYLPKRKRDWPGFKLIATAPASTSLARYPAGLRWTIEQTGGAKVYLVGEPCPQCGVEPRITVEARARDRALLGFRLAEEGSE